jgi:hypothetical protein
MRHFLVLALAPPSLAGGVMPSAPKRLLVTGAGPPQALAACLPHAFARAVALPMIAAPADPQLAATTSAVQQAIALDDAHHFSRRPRTGQRSVIASCSRQRDPRTAAIAPTITTLIPGRLEAPTSGLHLFGGAPLLSHRTAAENSSRLTAPSVSCG